MRSTTCVTTITLAVVVVFGFAASPAPARHPSAPTGRARITITIDNFSFSPQTITVKAGTEITWVNRDDVPHKIVSTDQKSFASPVLDTDGRFVHAFAGAGTFEYFCSIHPMMTGKIIVK